MHARDHRADDADIGLAHFQGCDIGDARAAQQKVERLPALRRRDRAQPHGHVECLGHETSLEHDPEKWSPVFGRSLKQATPP